MSTPIIEAKKPEATWWNRALTAEEVKTLYEDPFIMFKNPSEAPKIRRVSK